MNNSTQQQKNDLLLAAVAAGIEHAHLLAAVRSAGLLQDHAPAEFDEGKPIKVALMNALRAADLSGSSEALISAMVTLAPGRKRLLAITASLALETYGASTRDTIAEASGFEVMLSRQPFAEPLSFAKKLLQASRRVCLIQTQDGFGTGFLIGPNVVMTAGHVVEDARTVTCIFDYLESQTAHDPCEGEVTERGRSLDYAVITLDSEVGHERIEDGDRGWIEIGGPPRATVGYQLLILQHPLNPRDDAAMRLRLHTGPISRVDGDSLIYSANTARGSSGSPVLSLQFAPLAVHVAAGNSGVLVKAINAARAAR